MSTERTRICPVKHAGRLDNKIRRWLQDPKKILDPFVKKGMCILDFGCGPGFLTVDISEMVGELGKVIAVDVQEEMLDKLRDKIKGLQIEHRIQVHKCTENNIGIIGPVDFACAFYVIHEVPNKGAIFKEIYNVLRDGGYFLLAEPKLFHVSKNEFAKTVRIAMDIGFGYFNDIRILFTHAVVLKKG